MAIRESERSRKRREAGRRNRRGLKLKNCLRHSLSCHLFCCCCSALSQSEFMWHKQVNFGPCGRFRLPVLSSLPSPPHAFLFIPPLDCIEKWMKLECLMAFWIGFRSVSLSSCLSLCLSVSVFIWLFVYSVLCLVCWPISGDTARQATKWHPNLLHALVQSQAHFLLPSPLSPLSISLLLIAIACQKICELNWKHFAALTLQKIIANRNWNLNKNAYFIYNNSIYCMISFSAVVWSSRVFEALRYNVIKHYWHFNCKPFCVTHFGQQ